MPPDESVFVPVDPEVWVLPTEAVLIREVPIPDAGIPALSVIPVPNASVPVNVFPDDPKLVDSLGNVVYVESKLDVPELTGSMSGDILKRDISIVSISLCLASTSSDAGLVLICILVLSVAGKLFKES